MAKKTKKQIEKSHQELDVINTLGTYDEFIAKANIEKSLILQNALRGNDIDAIYKAQQYLNKNKSSNQRTDDDRIKTMFVDPMSTNVGLGYQDKQMKISFAMLRQMGRVPVIKSIIGLRINQITKFAQPQTDKYSTGFIIRPKKKVIGGDGEYKLSKEQESKINDITEFILNCGVNEVDPYAHDGFETFLTKIVKDSLELDQGCFQLTQNIAGDLFSFEAVDGATIRIADTYFKQFDNDYKEKNQHELIDDYLPFYVQIYMNKIINEYRPWDLAFNVRNPQTDIYKNGYGISELEDLVSIITNILNADSYNANFFKIGSAPKGIIRVSGNFNASRLEEFKNQWQANIAGVRNAHRTPVIEAEKMDFIQTGSTNRDMEYSRWYEFLLKLASAVYACDPAEINFPLGGSSEQKAMFDSSQESKIKNSKDKGLKPLLSHISRWINKHIVQKLDKDFEFVFCGLESEDAQAELNDNIMKLQNFMSLNEIRAKYKLKELSEEDGGNMILNPLLFQMKMQDKMMSQQNPNGQQEEDENQEGYEDENYDRNDRKKNPFEKGLKVDEKLSEEISRILCED